MFCYRDYLRQNSLYVKRWLESILMEYHTPIIYHPGRVTIHTKYWSHFLLSCYEAGQCVFTWTSCDTLDPYLPKGLFLFVKKILEVDCLGGGESVLLAWWWYLHSLWSVEINNENEGPSLKCWKYIKGDESGGACLASRLLLLPAVWTQVQQFDQRLATTTVRCGLFV